MERNESGKMKEALKINVGWKEMRPGKLRRPGKSMWAGN
jgi:hypothetical protein